MSLINNQLVIDDLDFDSAKTNFITWLQGQPEFSDYNFSGSGLQILLDILAYNTHYNAFYYNMISNEMTISTAQIRDNIVKLAKALNYVPKSMSSATASVSIIVTPVASDNPATLVIPAYTPFLSQSVNGSNYNFVTTQAYTASFDGIRYVFPSIQISEGDVINYAYTATDTQTTFNIPNANIDTSTLIVNVTEANSNTNSQTFPYVLCADVSLLDANSKVYFLEGTDNSTYNVYFGDNILGRQLSSGDNIFLTYLNTNGPAANFANSFSLMVPLGTYSNVIIQSINSASGGNIAESNESIKYHAPISYSTQNRAVTLQDYNEILLRTYDNISSLNIWSGPDNIPPVYGQIMVSIKPPLYDYLSATEKQKVVNILADYNMPTIGVTMVDPEYTYILANVEVNYDPKLTILTQDALKLAIQTQIYNYATTQLSSFNGTFRESVFDTVITNADASILGVDTQITLQKRITPLLNTSQMYTLNFHTTLKQGSLNQNIYSTPSFTAYDQNGNLQNCFIEENAATYQGISEILINNPGFGFKGTPQILITGDGTGATAHAIIVNGALSQIILDNPGIKYTFATATVIGGGGYSAVLTPILTASSGLLQSYYISNSNKLFTNLNQGTIDYTNGIITLNNFNPLSVSNPSNQLMINAPPQRSLILPSKNNILLIDPNDSSAIQITLIPQSS